MDNTKEFRCLSLCTGYAGIELGLKKVISNFQTVCYVEREGFAITNLVKKIETGKLDTAPIWTDIKTFNGRPFHNRIHIITGGYPCQPFSIAGKRKGTDDSRYLWLYIEKIIIETKPIWCFFENVSRHLAIGFPSVYRSLRLMGYKVEAGLFTAAECGAPHKRERLFILGKLVNTEGLCNSRINRNNNSSQKEDRARLQQLRGRSELCQEMADTKSEYARTLPDKSRIRQAQTQFRRFSTMRNTWPSRPGQPQYEWEEPRVTLGKSIHRIMSSRGDCPESQPKTSRNGQTVRLGYASNPERTNNKKRPAQSRLGRAVNGTANRVDRLRLLGNGVVPQQAELAFRTLIKLF